MTSPTTPAVPPPLPLKQNTPAAPAPAPAAIVEPVKPTPFSLLCPLFDEPNNPFTEALSLPVKTTDEARLALLQFCICYEVDSIANIPKLLSSNLHEPMKSVATIRRLTNQVPVASEALNALRVCPRTLLTVYYLSVAPQMVPRVSEVLQKAYGHEDQLWPMLLKKYGPMPPPWSLFRDWEQRQRDEDAKAKQHQQRLQEFQSRGMTRLRNLRRAQSFSPEEAEMLGRDAMEDDIGEDMLLEANVDGKRRIYRRDRQQIADDLIFRGVDDDYDDYDDFDPDGGHGSSMSSDPSFALFSPSSFNASSPSFAGSPQRSFARRSTVPPLDATSIAQQQPVAALTNALAEDEAEKVLRLFHLDPKELVEASEQLAVQSRGPGTVLPDLEISSQQGAAGDVQSENSFSWAGSFVSSPRQMRRRVSFTDAAPTSPTNADGKLESVLIRQSSVVKPPANLPRRRTMAGGDLFTVSAEDMNRL